MEGGDLKDRDKRLWIFFCEYVDGRMDGWRRVGFVGILGKTRGKLKTKDPGFVVVNGWVL